MTKGQPRLLDAAEQIREKGWRRAEQGEIQEYSARMGKAGSIYILPHTHFRVTKTPSFQ